MKTVSFLLLLLIATKQISSQEEDETTTISSEVITRNKIVTLISAYRNLTATTIKTSNTEEKIDSTVKETSTVAPSDNFLLPNATQASIINVSTLEENVSIGHAKQEGIDLNSTTRENISIMNSTEEEINVPIIINETSTFTEPTMEENLSTKIPKREEIDTNSTSKEDVLITNTTESEGKNTSTVTDAVSTLADKVQSVNTKLHNDSRTEINFDIVTTPKLTAFDPQEYGSYCKDYLQKLLNATFSKHAMRLDPIMLKNKTISIESNVILSTVRGEVGLYNGRVNGMSAGKLVGECTVQISHEKLILIFTLSFDGANLSYKGKATFMNLGPKIAVNGELEGSLVEVRVAVPKEGGIGEINGVKVRRIGRMFFDVEGLGPLNWSLGFITREVEKIFDLNFKRAVEKELRNALEEEVIQIDFP